jgi:hypothetical protein
MHLTLRACHPLKVRLTCPLFTRYNGPYFYGEDTCEG